MNENTLKPESIHKQCPKCDAYFECKATDITNCQCNTIQLNVQARNLLKKANYNAACLCKNCLAVFNELTQEDQNKS